MKLILFIIALSSFNLFASDVVEIDFISEMDDESYREATPTVYRGEGVHQCQSRDSIGHTCENAGVNFTDCNVAFFKLKMTDCCPDSRYGGNSINFKLTKCSYYN
jgi:hypothetical protein